MEENRAILEELENDREATMTYLESHGDDSLTVSYCLPVGLGLC